MQNSKTFLFSADHVCPEWQFQNEAIKVSQDSGNGGFYSDHPRLGCSKTYNSAESAIRGMVAEHGCFNIVITGPAE
jgi:hypothetical protein